MCMCLWVCVRTRDEHPKYIYIYIRWFIFISYEYFIALAHQTNRCCVQNYESISMNYKYRNTKALMFQNLADTVPVPLLSSGHMATQRAWEEHWFSEWSLISIWKMGLWLSSALIDNILFLSSSTNGTVLRTPAISRVLATPNNRHSKWMDTSRCRNYVGRWWDRA